MSKVFIEESTLTSIGDAIRAKTGKSDLISPGAMPTEIESIETGGGGLPEEALNITGDCRYRFASGGWDWFIKDYGSRVKTSDITNIDYMFIDSNTENIPFDLNIKNGASLTSINNLFGGCKKLKSIPKINGKPKITSSLAYVFSICHNLRYIPDDFADWFDWSAIENSTSTYAGAMNNFVSNCYSLRSIPMDIFNHVNPNISSYTSIYFYGCFSNCYCLDELVGLPMKYTSTWTSNAFNGSFGGDYRLKNITFAMPDGLPVVAKWKNQTINLSNYIGYYGTLTNTSIIGYNSGITADKEVKDDATYQALKNDPDWFTKKYEYSRYNHDSAVATINSLPDTSAYLATAGGTNTIKFKGAAGSKTDGGAINTLTEEEIAVATAKGWTVTLA